MVMSQAPSRSPRATSQPPPTWDVAYLFPPQGAWSEEEFLALSGNRLVEFSHGVLEVLPMPTTSHQVLVAYLYGLLLSLSTRDDLGTVLFAPLRIRLGRGKFREPDLVFLLKEHAHRIGEEFWEGADLVMEVVSGEERDRRRDLVTKRNEYARAGIAEYWIVDAKREQITVLRLVGKRYVVQGEFGPETTAASHLLPGFTVDVREALAVADRTLVASKRPRSPRRSSKS
jgi:Uma2 family endonuclease